jgi:type II secretory ATPase GspE/PulE/Tfp pilus assembly ATPase PilB-like protein
VARAPESAPVGDAAGKSGQPGPPTRTGAVHWLLRVIERAGLAGPEVVDLPATTSAREAWPVITRAFSIDDTRLAILVAEYFRLEVADLAHSDPNAVLLIPEAMARKHSIYPLHESDRQILVATCDPTDVEAERALGFSTGRSTVFAVAAPQAIQDAIDGRFAPEKAVETLLGTLESELDAADAAVKLVEEMGPEHISEDDVQATPVVKLTNLILRDGIAAGASDIHIEPGRKTGTIRYRVDGVLRKHMDLPMPALNRIISRVKILSKLDIADRLRPQDGKSRVRIKNLSYDLRVSTIPAGGAEKCVIRILDSNVSPKLPDLGLPAYELERMRALIANRDGLVIVTGPTGSGKTTTLYGALRELADGKVNIMTVEDPIEYDLPAITQTQVENKQGLTFAAALRSILRQDPDVILVGEIRDRETAETAVQAAMTGHLVLATVHANDAVSAVGRLTDMGLQHAVIGQTLRGALAQRLMRKVCPACAEPVRGVLTPDEKRLRAPRDGAGGARGRLLGVRVHGLPRPPSRPGSADRRAALPAGGRAAQGMVDADAPRAPGRDAADERGRARMGDPGEDDAGRGRARAGSAGGGGEGGGRDPRARQGAARGRRPGRAPHDAHAAREGGLPGARVAQRHQGARSAQGRPELLAADPRPVDARHGRAAGARQDPRQRGHGRAPRAHPDGDRERPHGGRAARGRGRRLPRQVGRSEPLRGPRQSGAEKVPSVGSPADRRSRACTMRVGSPR